MPEEYFDSQFSDGPEFDELGRLDESDDPACEDLNDDEGTETVPCPNCGAEVYEDSPQCPACGEYVTHLTHAFAGRPWWWIVLGLIGIAATIYLLTLI